MRIVSYNILDGGVGRADPIAEVLLAQRPDVVGLVEADDPEILDRIAWRLGWDYIAAEGPTHTAALLTRGRILESINHARLLGDRGPRSFLEATVELDGAPLPVGVIHLSAKGRMKHESVREAEMAKALRLFAGRRQRGERHVLIGDFNANSPIQQIVRERLKLTSQNSFDANGGDLPRRVIAHVLAAGYVDTLAEHNSEAAAVTGTFTTLRPGQRVDYIFSFGFAPRQIARAWVETDRLATYASDHYPVGVELALS